MKKIICDHCGVDREDVKEYILASVLSQALKSYPRQDLCDKCVKKVKDAFYGSVGN